VSGSVHRQFEHCWSHLGKNCSENEVLAVVFLGIGSSGDHEEPLQVVVVVVVVGLRR
jgi:hypothetical protein